MRGTIWWRAPPGRCGGGDRSIFRRSGVRFAAENATKNKPYAFSGEACPGPDPGWAPVRRRKCDLFGHRARFAQTVAVAVGLQHEAAAVEGGQRRAVADRDEGKAGEPLLQKP